MFAKLAKKYGAQDPLKLEMEKSSPAPAATFNAPPSPFSSGGATSVQARVKQRRLSQVGKNRKMSHRSPQRLGSQLDNHLLGVQMQLTHLLQHPCSPAQPHPRRHLLVAHRTLAVAIW
jgi:hypothetical protein